jgi:hypothetical protein
MAGDWIKVRVNLADDPAVFAMASQLNLSNEAVVGHLIRVWSWATNQLEDGHAASVTECVLDRVSGAQGMTKAMLSVTWLSRVGTGFKFPRWERHLSQGAKARALATERQRKGRSRKCHAESVTETRPEKRREEKSSSLDDDDDKRRNLTREQLQARIAALTRRPDWMPQGKPWVSQTAAARLATDLRLTTEILTAAERVARDGRNTLKNPAGCFLTEIRKALKEIPNDE